MTAADLLNGLWESALASAAAVVMVLLLRAQVRQRFGARVGYALWAMVPVAAMVMLLPGPVREVALAPMLELPGTAGAPAAAVQSVASFDWTWPLLSVWLVGAAWAFMRLARGQRRFTRSLGKLQQRADGLWQADATAGLPAVIGLRPRIVVPADFDQRFADGERHLIVAHERLHARRGDLPMNAAAAAIRCIYWFNPLLTLALDRFRRDQELACDQSVLARHPGSRRTYGEAMLKAGGVLSPAPLACQWSGHHPLKERITMLAAPLPTVRRQAAGRLLVLALASAVAYGAWAQQPERIETSPVEGSLVAGATDVTLDATPNRSRRQAAEDVARKAGLTLLNPEAISASENFSEALGPTPAVIALALISGKTPQTEAAGVRILDKPLVNGGEPDPTLGKAVGDRKVTITANSLPASTVARTIADELQLKFDGNMPGGDRKLTMQFNNVPAASVLQILGEETGTQASVSGGELKFVPLNEEG